MDDSFVLIWQGWQGSNLLLRFWRPALHLLSFTDKMVPIPCVHGRRLLIQVGSCVAVGGTYGYRAGVVG